MNSRRLVLLSFAITIDLTTIPLVSLLTSKLGLFRRRARGFSIVVGIGPAGSFKERGASLYFGTRSVAMPRLSTIFEVGPN